MELTTNGISEKFGNMKDGGFNKEVQLIESFLEIEDKEPSTTQSISLSEIE